MKSSLLTIFLCATLCLTGCGAQAEQTTAPPTVQLNEQEQAITAVQKLTEGDVIAFYQLFDGNLKKEMPQTDLQNTWNRLCLTYGDFQYYLSDVEIHTNDGYQIANIPCVFTNGNLTLQLTFNKTGEISGFYVDENATASSSLRLSNDVAISFGTKNTVRNGSLTVPEGTGPFPAVILVQDIGMTDRNAQQGPNLPLLEIADQLSQQGVAVLRYDRPALSDWTNTEQFESFTVQEEIIADVVQAFQFLQTRGAIQQDQIYIAGYGFSGYLIPRIAAQTPEAAGYLLLAAGARPLEDILLERTAYILSIETELDKTAKQKLFAQTEETANQIKQLTVDTDLTAKTLWNLPPSYWLDLQNYTPLEDIQQIKKPLCILQGGRDYQSTTADFELWKTALVDYDNVVFHYYDNLNHLFMPGTGKSTPSEYQQKSAINFDVCNDMAHFIQKSSKKQ